jgi:hypothetical protein
MKLIGKDHILLERLTSDIYILSSSIKSFNIFTTDEDELIIEVVFELLYNPGSFLKLRFMGIKEYSFYWNSTYNFYYVETYKLIKKQDLFYISFDPEDETSLDISEADQDFILFNGFEGYYIDPIPYKQ